MAKFSARERMALKALSNLKHNGTEFIECRFNDCLLNFVKYVLRINPFEVADKALANMP